MRFLITLLIIYLVFRFFVRFILPLILTSVVKKAQKDFEQNVNTQYNRKPEGEITIENIKSKQGRAKDDGDFAEYEEIK